MTATATRTRKPFLRFVRLNGNILGIQLGKAAFVYLFDPIPADFGIGFLVRRQEPVIDEHGTTFQETDVYAVNVDPAGKRHSCECLGFLSYAHCKHVDALFALYQEGKLPLPANVRPLPALTLFRPAPESVCVREPFPAA